MRRVRLVRALVMRGQSHCQRSGVKVGRERGQYTWTSPHPTGTSTGQSQPKVSRQGSPEEAVTEVSVSSTKRGRKR